MEIIECRHGTVKVDMEDFHKIIESGWNIGTQILVSGYINVRMYRKINKKSKQKSLSRFITDAPEGKIVTFKDKDTLNLRKKNLIVTDHTGKRANAESSKNARSIYKGVYRNRGKWAAQIRYKGKSRHLGSFDTEMEAAKRYDIEAKKVFKGLSLLNFNEEK